MFSTTKLVAAAVALLGAVSQVNADCKPVNSAASYRPSTDPPFCNRQGPGDWTFTMNTADIDVPTFDGSNPFAGYVSHTNFIIYDENCNVRGVYPKPSNCEIPYTIEDPFLPYVLTIRSINTESYYSFDYANGRYSIGNNHCVCHNVSHGLTGEIACPCAFPINGEP